MKHTPIDHLDQKIAQRMKQLRSSQGWSLEELAQRSGVSRATLSRLENAEVSANTSVLGKLCACYDLPMSRLMFEIESDFDAHLPPAAQPVWRDPDSGYVRRSISPPSRTLAGEVLECTLPPAAHIHYDQAPRAGLEHHLWMLDGALILTLEGKTFQLKPGDCLRYQLHGSTDFHADAQLGARYILFIV